MEKDEMKDSFTRLKELAQNINQSIKDKKFPLASAQINKLFNDLDVLEAEIEFWLFDD